MKRFGIAATQGKGADIFGIERLPANRDLWLLCVILAVRRRLKWESSRRQNSRGVVGIDIQERIKCGSWVGIQKCFPQSRLAGFANGQVLPIIPGIPKTELPVPRLEIMAKFSHLTTQPHVKQ